MPKATFQVFSDINTKVVGGYVEPKSAGGGGGKVQTERVENVMGSSAGAGSGEFHMYLNSRNREKARMESIDAQRKKEEDDKAFQEKLELNRKVSQDRTDKNSKKRQKAKARKEIFKKDKKLRTEEASVEAGVNKTSDSADSDRESDEEKEEPIQEYWCGRNCNVYTRC